MINEDQRRHVVIGCVPGLVATGRIAMAAALMVMVAMLIIVSGWLAVLPGLYLTWVGLYWSRVSRVGGVFTPEGATVSSPLFDRTIAVNHIRAIGLSGTPGFLLIVARDGGYTIVQIGRNMFERAHVRANRLYQIKKLEKLYADHDITVGEDAQTGIGWNRRTPMTDWKFIPPAKAELAFACISITVTVLKVIT